MLGPAPSRSQQQGQGVRPRVREGTANVCSQAVISRREARGVFLGSEWINSRLTSMVFSCNGSTATMLPHACRISVGDSPTMRYADLARDVDDLQRGDEAVANDVPLPESVRRSCRAGRAVSSVCGVEH